MIEKEQYICIVLCDHFESPFSSPLLTLEVAWMALGRWAVGQAPSQSPQLPPVPGLGWTWAPGQDGKGGAAAQGRQE